MIQEHRLWLSLPVQEQSLAFALPSHRRDPGRVDTCQDFAAWLHELLLLQHGRQTRLFGYRHISHRSRVVNLSCFYNWLTNGDVLVYKNICTLSLSLVNVLCVLYIKLFFLTDEEKISTSYTSSGQYWLVYKDHMARLFWGPHPIRFQPTPDPVTVLFRHQELFFSGNS